MPRSNAWKARKDKAADMALAKLRQEQEIKKQNAIRNIEEDEDEYDEYSDENEHVAAVTQRIDAETNRLSKWINSLPTCHLLTLGFDFSGSIAGEKCYCPCHDKKMSVWRELTSVSIAIGAQCKGISVFEKPNHLVAHLKQNADLFHQYTLHYLEELYGDWYPDHLKHKGFVY